MKRVIVGAVSGAGTVIVMDTLRESSYMGGASVLAKAALAGIIAGVIYMIISAIIKLARPAGASKA